MEKENKTCGCGHDHDHDHKEGECCGKHEHDHEHECGCGHDHETEEFDTMVLTLDDDTELECIVLGTFDYKDKSYIALLPTHKEDGEEVFIYEFTELNDEEIDLRIIEDDDLFEEVSKEFEELFIEEE